jgi:hypothetical protein
MDSILNRKRDMEKSEEYMDTVIAAHEDFKAEIMPATKKAIKEMIAEAAPEFVRECRTEYLKDKMSTAILNAWHWIALYEEDTRKDLPAINRLYAAQQINKYAHEISGLQGAVIAMRQPERKGQITDEMIQKAKGYDFNELIEFKMRSAMCPFHEGKSMALRLYPESNTVHCFACAKSWDTIAYIQDTQGKTFADAVKYLQ